MKNIYVISLGGSLVATRVGIDSDFLKKFRALILSQIKKGDKFYIIVGGGVTARDYIKAGDKVMKLSEDTRDWIGIHSTRLNARLIQNIFGIEAHSEIIKNPSIKIFSNKKIIVGGGWKPGRSTDYVAIETAKTYKIKTIINLSNIDYVCDKDPRKFKNAKKLENINWKDFRKIVGSKWGPGLSAPFDPIASCEAQKQKLKVVIMNGKKLDNLKNYFLDKQFKGTVIE